LAALGASVMPKSVSKACDSQVRDGVPRNSFQLSQKIRQILRPSVSTGPPSRRGTPRSSSRTPWLISMRKT